MKMQSQLIRLVYFLLTVLWSGISFTILLPDVKNVLYSKCVWRFNFVFCNKFFGVEGAYRLTFSIAAFYLIISIITINFHGNELIWDCQDSIFVKWGVFILTHALGFFIEFSRKMMEIMYSVFMFSSYVFIICMFCLAIDGAFALRMVWMKSAIDNKDKPTCYFCTWLFLTHLLAAFLYALSLDLYTAFYFFNPIQQCINTILYLSINVCLCLITFSVSYSPSLRNRQSSSHIIFSTVLFYDMLVSWIALSDPENSECDMYGTIFTGSLLDSSTNFRAVVLLIVAIPPLLFLCFKDTSKSYLWSLVSDRDFEDLKILNHTMFFLVMAGVCCYVLMAVTNYYEPVYSIIQTTGTEKRSTKTSVVYFEGENRLRFFVVSGLSSYLPILYLTLLLVRIAKTFLQKLREQRKSKLNITGSSVYKERESREIEFLYVQISLKNATKRLSGIVIPTSIDAKNTDTGTNKNSNILQYLLLPCFKLNENDLSFWHFPRNISQTYFKGRNGSNACTVIAVIFGRFFSRSDLLYQDSGYLSTDWMHLFYTAIEEGNSLYDGLVKELGVLDLSIEEVNEKLGKKLNVASVLPSLPVSFESDVETVTILYQLRLLVSMHKKQVVLFIHNKRTSAFLVYGDGNTVYVDSHAFGEDGALMISAEEKTLTSLVDFLKSILGNDGNRLATLTVLDYERRKCRY